MVLQATQSQNRALGPSCHFGFDSRAGAGEAAAVTGGKRHHPPPVPQQKEGICP